MTLVNVSKPTTTLTNTAKVSIGETWGFIATTWAAETSTWLESSQLIDNLSKVSSSITNTSKPA